MIYTMEKVEKMLSLAAEEEKEEVEQVEEEEEEEEAENDEEEDDDEEEEDGGDEEAVPQATAKTEKKTPVPVQPKDKKEAGVLNLNNEVVKMRKEVKRIRALISRKLTRQIAALKKKKGKEADIERNQRRAARLLEEIHAMKTLSPDLVTKTALQKNLNFDQVCKNPKSTISDRAVARIATHPQFSKKIEDINAAVKAFKEERMKEVNQIDRKEVNQIDRKEKVQNLNVKVTLQSPDMGERKGKEEEDEEEDSAVEQEEMAEDEEDGPLTNTKVATIAKPEKDMGKTTPSADAGDVQKKKMLEPKSKELASGKNSQVKDVVKNKAPSQTVEKKPNLRPEVLETKKDEEESDLEESDDEEKEYFDDSTEERFHKQSSQSEESDGDDDFFVGKVSKFKKKKKSGEGEEKKPEVKELSTEKLNASDQVQNELDELEARLKSKAPKLQSVFCSSLSKSKPSRGGGAGRGGDKFRGQGRHKPGGGLNRDFSKQSKFQKQDKGTEGDPGLKHSKPYPEGGRPESEERGFASAGRGRGRGRGRGDSTRQNGRRGGGVFSHQAPQQALHPSWEASKKRKEQQGQILAFQGKKIKFDDDD